MLARLAVPAQAIEREMAASQEVVLAETDSRSLLGTLNDFAIISGIHLAEARHRFGRSRGMVKPDSGRTARISVPGRRCAGAIRPDNRPVGRTRQVRIGEGGGRVAHKRHGYPAAPPESGVSER